MVTGFLARRGRTVLVWTAAVLFAVMVVAALVGHIPGLGITLLCLTGLFAIAFTLVPARDEIEVVDGALVVPGDPGLLVLGLAHLTLIASIWVVGVHDSARAAWAVLIVFFALPFLLYGPGLRSGTGVSLTPDGIRARKQSGSVWIPWAALATTQPPPDPDGTIVLALSHPSLIVKTAWPFDAERLPRHAVLAVAIRYYTANPEARAAIGTPESYERLVAEIGAEPLPARRERASRAARDLTVGGVVIVASVAIFVWTRAAFDGHGLIEVLPPLTAVPALFGAALVAGAFGLRGWKALAKRS
ncbi:hypothetical protein HH310_38140 [Actinoplanes sp. TBRC 11911]|uniref:hypothetical protein n=1 Tax=Actinoplanes sp. TBRC 11911 TaxID=2729386 RepID=UPI00145F3ABD|nr:hypothetical protein [Actinoplanes sp. TBRC 11911]NMO56984.1 hypothetical protein [Actinoplanes sp. TBRC 11911]